MNSISFHNYGSLYYSNIQTCLPVISWSCSFLIFVHRFSFGPIIFTSSTVVESFAVSVLHVSNIPATKLYIHQKLFRFH